MTAARQPPPFAVGMWVADLKRPDRVGTIVQLRSDDRALVYWPTTPSTHRHRSTRPLAELRPVAAPGDNGEASQ